MVVAVVRGGKALRGCLESLVRQQDPPSFEILVPHDSTLGDITAATAGLEPVRLVAMGRCTTRYPASSPLGRHELIDLRRSAGLAAARAPLVALIEDRSVPRPDWLREMVRAGAGVRGAVGGVVECADTAPLAQALFLCDYGRYRPPQAPGSREYLSDANVCYSRDALERTRRTWEGRFHESTVHWALARAGAELRLEPRLVVDHHRGPVHLASMLRERLGFGRLFASTRARETTPLRRAILAAFSPFLPLLLFWRIARRELASGRGRRLATLTPQLLALLTAWSVGELIGYLSAAV